MTRVPEPPASGASTTCVPSAAQLACGGGRPRRAAALDLTDHPTTPAPARQTGAIYRARSRSESSRSRSTSFRSVGPRHIRDGVPRPGRLHSGATPSRSGPMPRTVRRRAWAATRPIPRPRTAVRSTSSTDAPTRPTSRGLATGRPVTRSRPARPRPRASCATRTRRRARCTGCSSPRRRAGTSRSSRGPTPSRWRASSWITWRSRAELAARPPAARSKAGARPRRVLDIAHAS
jgi:hypothetical protein